MIDTLKKETFSEETFAFLRIFGSHSRKFFPVKNAEEAIRESLFLQKNFQSASIYFYGQSIQYLE